MNFRIAFSKRSWPYFMAVTLPWLIHEGQRSIRKLTHGAGLKRHESNFYRFFSEFKINVETIFKLLFESTVKAFRLKEILVVVDDTLCPKWGHHIFGTASFFDHASRPRPGYIWGHNQYCSALFLLYMFLVFSSIDLATLAQLMRASPAKGATPLAGPRRCRPYARYAGYPTAATPQQPRLFEYISGLMMKVLRFYPGNNLVWRRGIVRRCGLLCLE